MTEERNKPHRSRSGGQGVRGNAESGGSEPQGRRPKENEPTTSDLVEGRPSPEWGKPGVVHDGAVSEVGMRLWGYLGDIGKPSVLPTAMGRDAPGKGIRAPGTRTAGRVGLVVIRGRRGQGGGGSRSTDGASRNGRSGKGSWSTKGPAEEADRVTSRGWERDGRGTHLVLYEEPPREGEGASRPSGRSSVVGESTP